MTLALGEFGTVVVENENHADRSRLMEIAHVDQHGPTTTSISALTQRRNSPSSIAEPVRPIEFSMWIVFPLVTLFVLLAVALGVISSKAKKNGESLRDCCDDFVPVNRTCLSSADIH